MTDSELADLEESLDIQLPETYRQFMLDYPEGLLLPGFHAAECELLNSTELLIVLNAMVRSANSIDWPEEYFVIGESGCGDFYAIDIDDEDSSVYLWNHELGDFSDEEDIDSLQEYAGNLLQMYFALNAM